MTVDGHDQERRPPRRIGVLGAEGQLGRCLTRQIESAPDLAVSFSVDRSELDLSDISALPAGIETMLAGPEETRPQVVINAAAHTQVDLCESESALAYQVNALAPGEWARATAERGIRFIHVSTDYVFSGESNVPYRETDPTDPRTVYGASKRAGEIARARRGSRMPWSYAPAGSSVRDATSSARSSIRPRSGEAARSDGPLRVVDDQRGSPTSAEDLAFALLAIARQEDEVWGGGLLHLRNREETTWYGFARAILDGAGLRDIEIEPVSTSTFPTAANRPAYSVLDCGAGRIRGDRHATWPDAPQPLSCRPRSARRADRLLRHCEARSIPNPSRSREHGPDRGRLPTPREVLRDERRPVAHS